MSSNAEYYNLEQLVKSKIFRLKTAKKTFELLDLLSCTLQIMISTDFSESFSNAYLNIAEIYVNELANIEKELISSKKTAIGSVKSWFSELHQEIQTQQAEVGSSRKDKQNLFRKLEYGHLKNHSCRCELWIKLQSGSEMPFKHSLRTLFF